MAKVVMLGIVAFSSVIVAGWFAGEGRISRIFAQFQALQENPPFWLEVPMITSEYLLAPTVALLITEATSFV